ncbi:DnaJ domain-containing protein [Vibrio sinaloensis]|nr:DnaJ domain-containing protein [Vibrio sinaloensis]
MALACALFGYKPGAIPDNKQIKVRYKQLCKIYHPDLNGNEEDMKRLNAALKVILANVNN